MADDLEAFLRRAAELRRQKAAAQTAQQPAPRPQPRPYTDRGRERRPASRDESDYDQQSPTPLIERFEDEDIIVLSEASIVPAPDPVAMPATPRAPVIPVSTANKKRSRTIDGLIQTLKTPEGLRQAFFVREILDRKHF